MYIHISIYIYIEISQFKRLIDSLSQQWQKHSILDLIMLRYCSKFKSNNSLIKSVILSLNFDTRFKELLYSDLILFCVTMSNSFIFLRIKINDFHESSHINDTFENVFTSSIHMFPSQCACKNICKKMVPKVFEYKSDLNSDLVKY